MSINNKKSGKARKYLIRVGLILAVVILSILAVVKPLDRTPYHSQNFYTQTMQDLEAIQNYENVVSDQDSLCVAFSKVSLMPEAVVPLAGYGARDPKEYNHVLDSCFVRTLIFQMGNKQVAIITADLLLIHPSIRKAVEAKLYPKWRPEDLFLTATHTHSGPGGWASGLVVELFAGDFDTKRADFLVDRITQSVTLTEKRSRATLSYGELSLDDRVKNRLVGERGTTDPWLKVLSIQSATEEGVFTTFSAHATCLGYVSRALSGDYPARLTVELEKQFSFASFAAGAVGSMAPETQSSADTAQILELADDLANQISLLRHIGMAEVQPQPMASFRVPVALRAPAFKISENWALRPWVFQALVEEEPVYISIFRLGDLLFMGFPCDLSGELALPLYEEARRAGFQLIITSFNGGYMGYVPKDQWYDLPKYETRTMAWYGPDTGAYFSEIALKIIQKMSESDGNN